MLGKRFFLIFFVILVFVFLSVNTYADPYFPQIEKKDGGWDLFYSVSFEFIRRFFPDFEVFEGKIMKANCYKCSDLGEYPHYLSWSPIEGEPFSYHRTECFGTMTFVK